jgi:5-bromo-4-chloroindolyl phosphate hydrolysis protein
VEWLEYDNTEIGSKNSVPSVPNRLSTGYPQANMTKSEFQAYHGLTDSEMDLISRCLEVFKGTIVSIKETK